MLRYDFSGPPVSCARPDLFAWLLGSGLVLSTATQLRLSELSLGPGELLLIGWAGCALLLVLAGRGSVVPAFGLPFVLFWTFALAILCFDLILFDLVRGSGIDPYHDFLAYGLVLLLTAAFVFSGCPARRVLPIFVVGSTIALSLLFLAALNASTLGPIQPWYSFRFRGWAQNPNQLAFHLSIVPVLALFLMRESAARRWKILYGLVAVASIVVGFATFSDALVVAWPAALAVYLVMDYARPRSPQRGHGRGVVRYVLLPLVVVALLVAYGPAAFDRLEEDLVGRYQSGSQGSDRLTLWRHGLQAMGSSPVFGLGPGPQSGFYGPLGGKESHNSIIDWGASAGLLGLTAYLGLVGWLAVRIWRASDALLMAGLTSVMVMSLFHFTFRHPVFWFSLLFIAALSGRSSPGRRQDEAVRCAG